jgi:undecaprenyl-diphosphatase
LLFVSPGRNSALLRKLYGDLRGHRYFGVLLLLLVVLIAVLAFIAIADEVMEGDTRNFDEWAIRALRRADDPSTPIGPRWLHEAGRDVTAIGGVFVLAGLTLLVAGYLLLIGKRRAVWLIILATGGGAVLSTILKSSFDRQRPQLVPHLSMGYTSSFPSGHSMLSAVVYLTLGTMLAAFVADRRLKLYFICVALTLCLAVGVSRVYMGVHYPTDVLAGWAAGLAWALFCWVVAHWLQTRGAVEPDIDRHPSLPGSDGTVG